MTTSTGRAGRDDRQRLLAAGLAAAMLVGVTFVVFFKGTLFQSGYDVRAVFSSAAQLRKGSVVRVAGVDIGNVTKIEAGPDDAALVTMRITDPDVRIHADAQLSIEPRLLLEGNGFVAVRAGSPGAPVLGDGAVVPRGQTSVPVQLDQVIDTFETPTRQALTGSVAELARGLGGGGAVDLRRAVRALNGAATSVTTVARAAQGHHPGDLSAALRNGGEVMAQAAQDRTALANLMSNYARVSASLADHETQLAQSFSGIDRVLGSIPRTTASINAALPRVTRLADDVRPVLRAAPPALAAISSLLDQVGAFVKPSELPAFLRGVRPVTRTLPGLERQLRLTSPRVSSVSQCISRVVLPVLNSKIQDGRLSTGDEVWKDVLHAGAALAGTSPGFDGNGAQIRLGVVQGQQLVEGEIPDVGTFQAMLPRNGSMQPTWLGFGNNTPSRPDQSCLEQKRADLRARRAAGPADWLSEKPPPANRSKLSVAEARKALRNLGMLDKDGG